MPLSVGDQSEVGQCVFFRTRLIMFVDPPRHPSPTWSAGPAGAGARMGPCDRSVSFSSPGSGCCCAFFVFSGNGEFASPPASCDDDDSELANALTLPVPVSSYGGYVQQGEEEQARFQQPAASSTQEDRQTIPTPAPG